MDRRTFLKSMAGAGLAASAWPGARVLAREGVTPGYFGLHPFIEAHPEAVFIRQTHVATKNDWEAMRREAFELGRRIFTRSKTPGISVAHKIALKPNLTDAQRTGLKHAIVTDPYVTEGLIDGLRRAHVSAENIYVREGLMTTQPGIGYVEMVQRRGVHYGDDDSRAATFRDCPEGVVFRRTKFVGPFMYPDTHVINIAKLKTHSMGLTLCVKNLQGTNAHPYIQFCQSPPEAIAGDFQSDAARHLADLRTRHQQAGIPRWDSKEAGRMEMWAQRATDSYALLQPSVMLNIIEGVYAQNGNGFDGGPSKAGEPEVFMTNVLIFGKDAFRLDIIGHWLAGHEPGNFGLFHIGKERGVTTALNPRNIPIYRWENGGPKLAPLDQWARTPLTTSYLGREGEPNFHLCNEPFAYPTEPQSACLSGGERPGLRVLGPATPGSLPSSLALEYNLPADADASLEMYNAFGERVGVLAEGWTRRGVHMVDWDTQQRASGVYSCRLIAEGIARDLSITLAG